MPKRTLELLDQLEPLGFLNEPFHIIHHFGDKASINIHRSYCRDLLKKSGEFLPDGTNEKVRERLEIVLESFKARQSSEHTEPGVFRALAKEATAKIPVQQAFR
jgi:hypothetical protein